MPPAGVGYCQAAATVVAWGLWLLPSQEVRLTHQQTRMFYVTLGVLLLTGLAPLAIGIPPCSSVQFWSSFAGGVLWAASGWSAFIGTVRLGMARALGIWAPLNVLVSLCWGRLLFGEYARSPAWVVLSVLGVVAVMIVGIVLIVGAKTSDAGAKTDRWGVWSGFLGALGAGVGFASYFLPARLTHLSAEGAMLPTAAGMFAGGAALAVVSGARLRLRTLADYPRLMSSGWLWAIGNYCALLAMNHLGTGRAFALAQLCVVVNAIAGIVVLRDPAPGTEAAHRTLWGVVLATAAGIALGVLPNSG